MRRGHRFKFKLLITFFQQLGSGRLGEEREGGRARDPIKSPLQLPTPIIITVNCFSDVVQR